jgi:hypothetical protein
VTHTTTCPYDASPLERNTGAGLLHGSMIRPSGIHDASGWGPFAAAGSLGTRSCTMPGWRPYGVAREPFYGLRGV